MLYCLAVRRIVSQVQKKGEVKMSIKSRQKQKEREVKTISPQSIVIDLINQLAVKWGAKKEWTDCKRLTRYHTKDGNKAIGTMQTIMSLESDYPQSPALPKSGACFYENGIRICRDKQGYQFVTHTIFDDTEVMNFYVSLSPSGEIMDGVVNFFSMGLAKFREYEHLVNYLKECVDDKNWIWDESK
jgi:hypothetical protein